MKILLDTNIILDVFLEREPNLEVIEEIFKRIIYQGEIKGYVTANSITDIYYIAAKRLGKNKTKEKMRDLLKLLEIISVDGHDCFTALDFPISDFEDAVVVACGGKVDIDYIVTNDKDFLAVDSKLASTVSAIDFLAL